MQQWKPFPMGSLISGEVFFVGFKIVLLVYKYNTRKLKGGNWSLDNWSFVTG